MDIYLENKLIHRESLENFINKSPNSILSFLCKINEDCVDKPFKFIIKLSKSPDSNMSYDDLKQTIELISNLYNNTLQVKIIKLNKYIIELEFIGLITDIIGLIMICDISSCYLDLLDTINTEKTIVKSLIDYRGDERFEGYLLNRSFIIKYLMEFNKMDTYKSTYESLNCLNSQIKTNILNEISNKIYGLSLNELLKEDKNNINNWSIESIDTELLGKIVKYVEEKSRG